MYGDIYYSPQNHGLEILGEIDYGGAYEFDKLVVWREVETDKVFYGFDSGCSCPSPFEGFSDVSSLEEVTALTWPDFKDEIDGWCEHHSDPDSPEKTDLLQQVSLLLA